MTTKQYSWTFKLLFVLCSFLLTLAVGEIGLRALKAAGVAPGFFDSLGRPNPRVDVRDGPGLYYIHPYGAYNLKPGYKSTGPGYSTEHYEIINSLGFRGEEVSLEKPSSTYRIVAIGESTTYGVYLDWNETYPYYLQRELRSRLGTDDIEVINAGLTGSTSAESLHRLFYQILPMKPDMVVIYAGYNDLFPRVFDNYQKDYYHFRRVNTHNPEGLSRFLLYRLLLRAASYSTFIFSNDLSSIVWKRENIPDSDNARVANFYATSSNEFRQNYEQFIKSLLANDVQPVLSTFAIKNDMAHWNDVVPGYVWEDGIRQNNEAIRSLAKQFDLPLIQFGEFAADLPAMNIWTWQAEKHTGCCFTDSIHLSAKGDMIQASYFADTIEPIVRQSMKGRNLLN